MSEFVEECRREWRRFGVPDAVANEMAADLTVDLDEAEADGGTPQDALGNSAFDPRRFAEWATARGVTGIPIPERSSRWPAPWVLVVTVLLGVLIMGAGLLSRSAPAVELSVSPLGGSSQVRGRSGSSLPVQVK